MESALHEHVKKQALYWLKKKVTDLCASEVKLYARRKKLKADAVGINIKRKETRIIEVKVSRSDFLRDEVLRAPYGYHAIADYAYLMTPAGLIEPGEIPEGYGLLEVDDYDNITVRKNPRKNPGPILRLETVMKRTAQAATNAVLFKELSRETRDTTAGAFARNASVHLVSATCPFCKKRKKYLTGNDQETVPCSARGCRELIPLKKARVHVVSSYNEAFFRQMQAFYEQDGKKED
ncbi:MmcB family DNA repair protein [Alteribacter natronophilus]|uniref:MmcB family DNA repair protein n=1 Tax=Alteribacter natronophilus TaxID=2583810 RepID=UPI00110EDF6F|nr:MmcB family DNA repair protein [Alteribacter natronophilus]TMW72906.1 MmcB family DNA repair protein [Alteribacter natronophilus]